MSEGKGRGRPKKFLTKEMILNAHKHTMSNMAAARYLGVSYNHYKMYARMYVNENGQTLLEAHSNPSGKGIPKFVLHEGVGKFSVHDILKGKVRPTHFNAAKIKEKLISEGVLNDVCYSCGMSEARVVDGSKPLLLSFKDANKMNFTKKNLEMLCYNCYFLYHGNIFTQKDIEGLEGYMPVNKKDEVDWNLNEFQKQHLKELGLWDQKDDDIDYSDLISKE